MEQIRQVRARGCVTVMRLALDRLPQFTGAPSGSASVSGRIQFGGSLDHLERAADARKYRSYPDQPLLMASIPSVLDPTLAPEGKHVMHVWAQASPDPVSGTTAGSDVESDAAEEFGDRMVTILDRHAPGLKAAVLHRQVDTPARLARRFGLTNGCLYHLDLSLDQLLYMRPIPGHFKYATPIRNLFLCGAGVHPGGAGTGLPGKCAARTILDSHG